MPARRRIAFVAGLTVVIALLGTPSAPADDPAPAKIVDGRPVPAGTLPFVAAILAQGDGDPVRSVSCTGALVAPVWVVTSSECVNRFGFSFDGGSALPDTTVVLGRTDLRGGGGETIEVASSYPQAIQVGGSIFVGGGSAEIGLLRLARPATTRPVPLADPARLPDFAAGVPGIVAGFGLVEDPRSGRVVRSTVLRSASPTVTAGERCVPDLPEGAFTDEEFELLFGDLLCDTPAPPGTPAASACVGDLGGPLLVPGSDGVVRLSGVVASGASFFGSSCGEGPTTYARADTSTQILATLVAGAPDGARDLAPTCPVPSRATYFDVPLSSPVARPVDCATRYGIVTGSAGLFDPRTPVNRGQMATVLVRFLAAVGTPLPAGRDTFLDDRSVHEPAIDALAAAGLVQGVAPGLYGPGRPVTRGQVASLITRALEFRLRAEVVPAGNYFADDDDSVHGDALDMAAEVGIITGRPAERTIPRELLEIIEEEGELAVLLEGLPALEQRVGPDEPVSRGELAALLVRALDLLVDQGDLAPRG